MICIKTLFFTGQLCRRSQLYQADVVTHHGGEREGICLVRDKETDIPALQRQQDGVRDQAEKRKEPLSQRDDFHRHLRNRESRPRGKAGPQPIHVKRRFFTVFGQKN